MLLLSHATFYSSATDLQEKRLREKRSKADRAGSRELLSTVRRELQQRNLSVPIDFFYMIYGIKKVCFNHIIKIRDELIGPGPTWPSTTRPVLPGGTRPSHEVL